MNVESNIIQNPVFSKHMIGNDLKMKRHWNKKDEESISQLSRLCVHTTIVAYMLNYIWKVIG